MLLVTSRRPAVTQLTPRELEVCELLGRGLTPKEIAADRDLSVRTVRGYIESARLRFGARTTHELVDLLARRRASRAHEESRTA